MRSVKKYQRIMADKYSFISTGRYNHATENAVSKKYGISWYAQQTPNNHHTKNKAELSILEMATKMCAITRV